MAEIVRAYVPSRFGQLHYRIVSPDGPATRPPLVFFHQTPSTGKDWEPILASMAKGRACIAFDTPGYGMSDAPPEPISIEEMGTIMADAVDTLGSEGRIDPSVFDVIGFHTGSLIATELAKSRPGRVRKAVVFGLAAYPQDVREEKLANLRKNFPEPADDLGHVEKLWNIIQQLSDPRMSAEHKHVNMAECLRLGSRMPWGYISVYRYDFLGAMPQVRQPVLIMNPQDDLWQVTSETSHLFPNGSRFDIPGVRHGVLEIEHDLVVETIDGFLTR